MAKSRLPGFDSGKLRALRNDRALAARDLADLTGISVGAVQNWEKGTSAPDPRHAKTLADALGVAVRDLTTLRAEDVGLAEQRALSGLVRSDLARTTQIPLATLGHIEVGHRYPTPEQAERIGGALGISADQVLRMWNDVRARRLERLRRTATQARSEISGNGDPAG